MTVLPFFKAPVRKINRVFIHCSASDRPEHDDISVIKKWHTSPDPKDPSKPWADVGYHYYIKFNGEIQHGRGLEITPAAQGKPNNSGTISICLSGGQNGKSVAFTLDQFEALVMLCQSIRAALPEVTYHGHCEVSPKPCPVFDYKALLKLDEKGRMKD